MAYTSISVEGGLFPIELLDQIGRGDSNVIGQRPEDFKLKPTSRISDETQSAFSAARDYWKAFQSRLEHSKESRTTITREDWVLKFFELLDFDLVFQNASLEAGGEKYAISHRAGNYPEAIPIHIAAIDQSLDHRDGGRRSPHAMVQEYLNRSDMLWGMVTNGSKLRLLRNVVRISKPTYLEFDLEGMVSGNLYSEFVLLYRLLHSTRFPAFGTDWGKSFIETYYQEGIDEGGRVREKLRDGVKKALEYLGTGFLSNPNSNLLKEKFSNQTITESSYYRQLLRLVYRFLFLSAAEERHLLFPPNTLSTEKYNIFRHYYSVSQLRDRAERYFRNDTNSDAWLGLIKTFDILRDENMAEQLGLAALNGELFNRSNCQALENAFCSNENLLSAVRELSTFLDEGNIRRRVNYADLDVEEFGSVYESLLDYRPRVNVDGWTFSLVSGSERKQTGSYYTPPELVKELIESALVPVMADRLKGLKTKEAKEKALLGLRVCDPAAGSGHFLLAAARRIAHELATVRSEEAEPTPMIYHNALRDVVRNCIYAVDKNQLAVDLCKVALWMEGHCAGYPLGFLDHHIKHGDSLVGVFDLKVLKEGIPDGAYEPVTGDNKDAARAYKKRNISEKANILQFGFDSVMDNNVLVDNLASDFQTLATLEEKNPREVTAKEKIYEQLRHAPTWEKMKNACDLWTAAFFLPLESSNDFTMEGVPTTQTIRQLLSTNTVNGQLMGLAMAISHNHTFFHWELEFPDVFQQDGFDVVLGNPPWDMQEAEDSEFFAKSYPEITSVKSAKDKKNILSRIKNEDPLLWCTYEMSIRRLESENKFVMFANRFPLSGVGRLNLYRLFLETAYGLANPNGRVGMVIPSGFATDYFSQTHFADLHRRGRICSLYDFENKDAIFQAVHRSFRFCLITITVAVFSSKTDFVFYARSTGELRDIQRRTYLSHSDVSLLNPLTSTTPLFRSQRDYEINRRLYQNQIIVGKTDSLGEWNIEPVMMFMMNATMKGHLSEEELLKRGYTLKGNCYVLNTDIWLPLYEGKMVGMYDHRAASIRFVANNLVRHNQPLSLSDKDHANPLNLASPLFWVSSDDVSRVCGHLPKWCVVIKDITSSTNERTAIAAMLPGVGLTDSVPWLSNPKSARLNSCLLANLNSYVFDYAARQKVAGLHLRGHYLAQLPIIPLRQYQQPCQWFQQSDIVAWITPSVLELTYTAWDLEPFAHDVGHYGNPFNWDEERRFLIRCELDATFFHLYGVNHADTDYIMDTFPIVKRKDEDKFGEYRTKRVVLEIYDEMANAIQNGQPYQTRLDPPPGDPRAAHQP